MRNLKKLLYIETQSKEERTRTKFKFVIYNSFPALYNVKNNNKR